MFIINTNTHLSSSDGIILRMFFTYNMKERSTIAFSVKRKRLFVESFEPTYKQLCLVFGGKVRTQSRVPGVHPEGSGGQQGGLVTAFSTIHKHLQGHC